MTGLSFSLAAWKSWPAPAAQAESGRALPLALRRRVSAIGRRALEAAWQLEPDANARLVLSSRHGEYERTISLLTQLTDERSVSPADFSLSVHSALAGLLSIATANHSGLSAVAAGRDSFGYGLLEAAACLADDPATRVLLVHFDGPLPEVYSELGEAVESPLAAALSLSVGSPATPRIEIDMQPASADEPMTASLAGEFVRFLSTADREGRARGDRMSWRWRRQ